MIQPGTRVAFGDNEGVIVSATIGLSGVIETYGLQVVLKGELVIISVAAEDVEVHESDDPGVNPDAEDHNAGA